MHQSCLLHSISQMPSFSSSTKVVIVVISISLRALLTDRYHHHHHHHHHHQLLMLVLCCKGSAVCAVIVDRCAVRFVPRENGVHWVHVRHNSLPIPGSPFRCIVGSHDCDVSLVTARGRGLSAASIGNSSLFPSLSVRLSVRLSVCLHSFY